MAESPAHKFGQIIGNLLEEIVGPILKDFCNQRGLYLDRKEERGKARAGKKVTWEDKYGNKHDLDFVIEKDGLPDKKGRPLAFIEVAWRRYTKHSRNKVQEIQGAIIPIAERYKWDIPFLGAVLAGIFTDNSINQIESFGFNVLYIPYKTIINAFCCINIDAQFDESTRDEEFKNCVNKIESLATLERESFKQKLIELNQAQIDKFFSSLAKTLDRLIYKIIIVPLYGKDRCFQDISSAINFIAGYNESIADDAFKKYEIIIEYSNRDKITAEFSSKDRVTSFLKNFSS